MSLAARDDTIAAIATAVAAGAGSVAIVRVSGPEAEAIGRRRFLHAQKEGPLTRLATPSDLSPQGRGKESRRRREPPLPWGRGRRAATGEGALLQRYRSRPPHRPAGHPLPRGARVYRAERPKIAGSIGVSTARLPLPSGESVWVRGP